MAKNGAAGPASALRPEPHAQHGGGVGDAGVAAASLGRASFSDSEAKRLKRKLPLECRVEGCGVDLLPLKMQNKSDYRVRYKICEEHLKALQVHTEGRIMRFCQQCTALHDVDNFDGNKRSCRDRLTSHNARRRKKRLPSDTDDAKAEMGQPSPMPGLQVLRGLLDTNALSNLTSSGGNGMVLSKIYELLSTNASQAGASPAKFDEPGSAQLLKSAADMLGNMGSTGVSGAIAALQAAVPQTLSTPVKIQNTPNPSPAKQPPQPSVAQAQNPMYEQLLGAYSKFLTMPGAPMAMPQQSAVQDMQQQVHEPGASNAFAGLLQSPAQAAVPASPSSQLSPVDGILLASLLNTGLLGQNSNTGSISDAISILQTLKQQFGGVPGDSSAVGTGEAHLATSVGASPIASTIAQLTQLSSIQKQL